jgi:hypothetical protein
MLAKQGWRAAWVLLVALVLPGAAHAGPYFGDWGWCWKECKDCPKGSYSPLHYWTPEVYRIVYCCHRAHLDEYPPGLPVPVGFTLHPNPCRTLPPMPTDPYADAEAFYGRPVIPTEEQVKAQQDKQKEQK